ncbi:MAG: hypothetical protein WCV92_04675 [Candidatus Buchananbacteria bacterium]
MKKWQYLLIALTAVVVFFVVFKIHLDYHFPYHVDEWHHISESIRLGNYGEYFQVLRMEQANKFTGIEIGFHFFLFLFSFVFNLVSVYQFFPAIWAVLSILALFFVIYKKSNNFWLAWLSIVFFASIKSNVNITGIWFFTPLSFALPIIFLYFYFITEGIEKYNKKYLLVGMALMLLLIPIHSISVLFSIPALIVYCLFHYKKVLKNSLFIYLLLAVILAGLLFYKYVFGTTWLGIIPSIIYNVQFRYGWGVVEDKMSLFALYSWIGYLLAVIGALFLIFKKEYKKYSIYLIWPIAVFCMMIIYRLTGVSYLSPYQRNLYYFIIALPFLSAFGFYSIIKWFLKIVDKIPLDIRYKYSVRDLTIFFVSAGVIFITFFSYYYVSKRFELYRVVEKDDREMLTYLSQFPRSTVMATPMISTAMFSIAHKDPVGDLVFYGNRKDVEAFYLSQSCDNPGKIIQKYNVKYIIAPFIIDCDFSQLVYKNNSNYLYRVK